MVWLLRTTRAGEGDVSGGRQPATDDSALPCPGISRWASDRADLVGRRATTALRGELNSTRAGSKVTPSSSEPGQLISKGQGL